MTNFAVWLKRAALTDPAAKEVQDVADANAGAWPYGSDALSDYLKAVVPLAAVPNRDRVLTLLAEKHEAWAAGEGPAPRTMKETFQENFSTILLAAFGVIVALIIGLGVFWDDDFLASLADPGQARGLITFLFAFSTVAVIILVAIATFWMELAEVKERFASAKDLITIVIGVLGTILGFYFGSATGDLARGMYLANVAAPAEVLRADGKAEIGAVVVGGTAPYEYDIAFAAPTGAVPVAGLDVKARKSAQGGISETVTIPKVTGTGPVSFTVTVRDAKGASATARGMLFVTGEPPPVGGGGG